MFFTNGQLFDQSNQLYHWEDHFTIWRLVYITFAILMLQVLHRATEFNPDLGIELYNSLNNEITWLLY
jgi:hypothetical protein